MNKTCILRTAVGRFMAMNRKLMRLLSGLALYALTLGTANALVIYDWTGSCSNGCTGNATAMLTLADTYTAGSALTLADFVSFTYQSSSSIETLSIPGNGFLDSITGTLPALTGTADVRLDFFGGSPGVSFFETLASGAWEIDSGPPPDPTPSFDDDGNNGTWTIAADPIPEPTTLALLSLGLVGLGVARKKKKT